MPNHHILIVDDEENLRFLLQQMLEPLECHLDTAADGQEAYERIQQQSFDLIISDLKMPVMDGLTLLKKIREDGVDAAFIILTGHGDLPQALIAREKYNISNFLVKPIHNLDQFFFDVESAISRRALEKTNRDLVDQLQQVNADLEDKVKQRTRELEGKNQTLIELSNFRADVLKVLGHELRTPVAILNGYLNLLDSDPAQYSDFKAQIKNAMGRLRELVENTLELLKMSGESHFDLQLETVNPEALCRNVTVRIAAFLANRGIEIDLQKLNDVGPCHWDIRKIEVLVEELLTNAARASPDDSSISVQLEKSGEDVKITVRDKGKGIAKTDRERIFEPFVTLGMAFQHTSGLFDHGAQGVGIGLSTAKMWAELHNGRIEVEDNPDNEGIAFCCILPANPF